MRAVTIHRFGDPDVLRMDELPMPAPRDDEVLLKVTASSINPVDNKIRADGGRFVEEGDLPVTLGRDVVGTVEALGTRAHNMLSVGQRLFAMLGFDRGGWATHVVVKATEMATPPDALDDRTAAAVPLAALTAWQGLVDHGGLGEGKRVLIHGGSGGVGHFAVQIAKAHGATVLATASADSLDFVRSIGADRAIDYRAERFEDEAGEVDIVLDLIGGDTQTRSWQVLAPGGIIVSTLTNPERPDGVAEDRRGTTFVAEPKGSDLQTIADLIGEGRITPHVAESFAFDQVAAASRRLAEGHVQGKIVLTGGH